jgi:hypothetical protein
MKEHTKEQLLGQRLRIENTEGKPIWFTRITDAETGELIENILRVSIVLDVNSRCNKVQAWITLCHVVDGELQEEVIHHDRVELLMDAEVEQVGTEQ